MVGSYQQLGQKREDNKGVTPSFFFFLFALPSPPFPPTSQMSEKRHYIKGISPQILPAMHEYLPKSSIVYA